MTRHIPRSLARRRARLLLAAIVAGVALAAVGCGGGAGGGGEGAGAPMPDGASHVGADTPVFISFDTDFDGAQWQTLDALLGRLPSGSEALQSFFEGIESEGLDFDTDVRPAIGPEVDIALLELPADESAQPPVVVLTEPADPAAFEALLAKADDPLAWAVVDGWYVVSDAQANVDRALASADAGSLADSETFGDALDGLSGDPLVTVFVDGAQVTQALNEAVAAGGTTSLSLDTLGLGELRHAAIGLTAEETGIRVEGVAAQAGEDIATPAPAAAELPGLAPAGALVFVSFHGLDEGLSQLLDLAGEQTPDLDQQLAQLEAFLGISVTDDLLPIFEGEGALYVRPAAGSIPEVTVVLSPPDANAAAVTLDKLIAAVGAFGGSLGDAFGEGGAPSLAPERVTVGGVEVSKLAVSDELSLYYGAVQGRLVVTTAETGITDLGAAGPRLVDDTIYQEATQAAGLPAETVGFAYVNMQDGIALLETLTPVEPENQEIVANLRSLTYLVVHASGDASEARFSGFLGIE